MTFYFGRGEKDKISEDHKIRGSLNGKVPVRINRKTVLYVRPEKVQEIKEKYGLD